MKIGIISDTHDRLETINKAIEIFRAKNVNMIIHCGDWVSPFTLDYFDYVLDSFNVPVKSIFGNNEGDRERFEKRNAKLQHPVEFHQSPFELEEDDQKFVVYHGDDKEKLQELIDSQKYDVVLTGHTHRSRNETVGKTLVINPGSTCFAAESRIISEASIAIYDATTNRAEIIKFTKKELQNN